MTPETLMMLVDALDDSARWMLFSVAICVGAGAILLVALFGTVLLAAVWRWMVRNTWNRIVSGLERKALQP